MGKFCLEYVWIDGLNELRSKIKVLEITNRNYINKDDLHLIPEWNFDGSSTGQADGKDSDVLIKPVNIFSNPFIKWCTSYLILCSCYNKDGTSHVTNNRVKLVETYEKCAYQKPWFGIEQEYVLQELDTSTMIYKPYKWVNMYEPGSGPQGPYYCGVGGTVSFGRPITMKHLEYCMQMDLAICGTNAEVMASQWEYQLGPLNPVELSDQLWISRYVLGRVTEEFGCKYTLEPKPHTYGDFNGSGGHTNFSTELMREPGGLVHIEIACEKLDLAHASHMQVYGKSNELRLTGKNETSSIYDFSWGISNRGKSIRIPLNVAKEGCGYLEDRRPGANLDPYLVTEIICRTVCVN